MIDLSDDFDFSIEAMTPPRATPHERVDEKGHLWIGGDNLGPLPKVRVESAARPMECPRCNDRGPACDHCGRDVAPSAPTIEHASYLGASDLGAILGLDPMRTALDVFAEKRRLVPHETSPELEAGNDHEEAVVRGAARRLRRMGLAERVDYPGPGTVLGLPEHISGVTCTWMGATLDARVHHRSHGRVAMEVKFVGAGMAHAWGPEPAGAEAIPDRTLVQVHWQTFIGRISGVIEHDAPIAYVAADIGTDRRLYEIPIDDGMIDDLLVAGREWWKRHVIAGEMPEPTERDVATLAAIYPRAKRPLSPIVPTEVRELADEYAIASEITRRHYSERERIGAKLRAAIGDAAGYQWGDRDGGGKVTWTGEPRRLLVRIWSAA